MTKKILIIDDEPDVTYTIKNILEDNGFAADTFNDPILALDNYKVNFYDLVILVIKMPKINGFELYIKIREQDPKAKLYSKANQNSRPSQKINIYNEYLKTNIYIDNINVLI